MNWGFMVQGSSHMGSVGAWSRRVGSRGQVIHIPGVRLGGRAESGGPWSGELGDGVRLSTGWGVRSGVPRSKGVGSVGQMVYDLRTQVVHSLEVRSGITLKEAMIVLADGQFTVIINGNVELTNETL